MIKKSILLTLALAMLTACNGSSGENGNVLLEPVRVYEVDGWGANPDIYEFTPEGHKHMTCLLLVSGGDKSAGISCFPKEAKSKK